MRLSDLPEVIFGSPAESEIDGVPARLSSLLQATKGVVAFRYQGDNPNGSIDDIAGVVNEAGNVLGMMPHPEHAMEPQVGCGSTDGVRVLRAFLSACERFAAAVEATA